MGSYLNSCKTTIAAHSKIQTPTQPGSSCCGILPLLDIHQSIQTKKGSKKLPHPSCGSGVPLGGGEAVAIHNAKREPTRRLPPLFQEFRPSSCPQTHPLPSTQGSCRTDVIMADPLKEGGSTETVKPPCQPFNPRCAPLHFPSPPPSLLPNAGATPHKRSPSRDEVAQPNFEPVNRPIPPPGGVAGGLGAGCGAAL